MNSVSFRKSSFSYANAGCVEVGASTGTILMRDSKQHGTGPILAFPEAAWRDFTTAIRNGELTPA